MYISVYPPDNPDTYSSKMANCGQQREQTKDKGWGGDEKRRQKKRQAQTERKGHRRP